MALPRFDEIVNYGEPLYRLKSSRKARARPHEAAADVAAAADAISLNYLRPLFALKYKLSRNTNG